jgi:hypothetical protein
MVSRVSGDEAIRILGLPERKSSWPNASEPQKLASWIPWQFLRSSGGKTAATLPYFIPMADLMWKIGGNEFTACVAGTKRKVASHDDAPQFSRNVLPARDC